MNKREAMRLERQQDTLHSLGFTTDEADKLRRISMTLRRWHELECGSDSGCIERDEATQRTYWLNATTGKRYPTPDRETGARKRLAAIIKHRNARRIASCNDLGTEPLSAYIQTDPRGAALYILRPGDIPEGYNVESCYSRGICVY
jgi:hypothetical protein